MRAAARDRSIFINCPFDGEYKPLFDALTFAILYCGYEVRSALEINDAGELRLAKILRLIAGSGFSIHDISRIELDKASGLPRFNMPIELGIAIGGKHLGDRTMRKHAMLVLDSERYRFQRFASDLAGTDIREHGGSVAGIVAAVRDFLAPHADRALPGAAAILAALEVFEADLPAIAAVVRQAPEEVTFVDRLRHVRAFLEQLP